MNDEEKSELISIMKEDYFYFDSPLVDPHGDVIIGFGKNLTQNGISKKSAAFLLEEDIVYFSEKLPHVFNFYEKLDKNRKFALICICCYMGLSGLFKFGKMLACIEKNDFSTAAASFTEEQFYSPHRTLYRTLYEKIAEMIKGNINQEDYFLVSAHTHMED